MAKLITELAPASALTGTELAWVEQGGLPVKATTQAIANLNAGGGGLAPGTATDNTLRWNGSAWVENTVLKIGNSSVAVQSSTPQIFLVETGVTANNTRWSATVDAESFSLRAWNDAISAQTSFFTVNRTLNVIDTINLTATTVSVTGALTATSYNGVLAANLLDKTAAETITGLGWHFDDNGAVATPVQFTGGGTGVDIAVFTRDIGTDAHVAIHASSGEPQVRFNRNLGANIWYMGLDGSDQFVIGDGNVVNTNDMFILNAAGDLDIPLGKVVASDATSTAGSTIIEGHYSGLNRLNILGGEFSSGGTVLGFAARPNNGAAGFDSSAGNAAFGRAIMTLDNAGFDFMTTASATVAVGAPVTLTSRVTISNAGVLEGKQQIICAGPDTNPGTLKSSLSSNMLHIDGKEAIDGNDAFLRLNQNGDFSSGVYSPGQIRSDGGFVLFDSIELKFGTGADARMDFDGVSFVIRLPTEIALVATPNGAVSTYFNGLQQTSTKDSAAADAMSGLQVNNRAGVLKDVGFALMEEIFFGANLTVGITNWHNSLVHTNAVLHTLTFNTQTTVANGAVLWVKARTGAVTLVDGTMILTWYDGSGTLKTGNRTLAIGGWATITKTGDSAADVVGVGLS